ncbi:MAG: tetratricopeptide repeat protein [Gemmatimonadaceae bacterium]
MTDASQRAALDAVHAARPIVARLSAARDKEDLAADIIDAWAAVETGLRSLVGGSTLTGQMLIRELRQRHFLSLEQANALAEFHAARERAERLDYAPTEGDINATRDAFLKLETGLMGEPLPGRPSGAAIAPAAVAAAPTPVATDHVPATSSGRPAWLVPVLGLAGLVVVVGLAWWAIAGRGGSSSAYTQGVAAFQEGRKEAAEASFRKAATDDPNDPMPHVYLSRMERERGNLSNANAEAVKAVQLGPNNGAALRELAGVLFASQQFDPARTFYIRAIKADSTDRTAQGYLGCSLVRLGRLDEGARWLARAGTGAWSACAPTATGMPQQQLPIAPRP